jgi:hypothetical protein
MDSQISQFPILWWCSYNIPQFQLTGRYGRPNQWQQVFLSTLQALFLQDILTDQLKVTVYVCMYVYIYIYIHNNF